MCDLRAGLDFGSASVSLPSSRSIHMSHHSVHANRMRQFLINLLRASLQQIVFFDSTAIIHLECCRIEEHFNAVLTWLFMISIHQVVFKLKDARLKRA
mgnify:CR=1 FL=1